MKNFFLYIVLIIIFISCNYNISPISKQVEKMQQDFSKSELDSFRRLPESKAVSSMHFGYGLFLRNSVLGGKDKDTVLINYFISRNVTSRDDMSVILLKCLHRKLNGKNMKIDEIFAEKNKFLQLERKCKQIQQERLIKNLRYNVGDTVQVRLKINESDNRAYTIECSNMTHWTFDDKKDYLIKGKVLKNGITYRDIEENKFIKIIVLSVNKDVVTQLRIPKPKDTLEFTLNYDIIEPLSN